MAKRLLVVDDEETILYAYEKLFGSEKYGITVDAAGSMEEAIEYLKKYEYKVVLTDLRLGIEDDLGGFRLIESIRAHDKDIKIVLVTAYGGGDIEAQAYEKGADYFLEKPVPTKKLVRLITRLCK